MSGAVTRSVLVGVPRDRAFDAFVEVRDVLNWLADGAVIGRRAGGNWGLGWYADPDSDAGYHSIGVIESFEPPSLLVVADSSSRRPERRRLRPDAPLGRSTRRPAGRSSR